MFCASRVRRPSFEGTPAIRKATLVRIARGATFSGTGLDLLAVASILIAGRHMARVAGEAGAARIPAIDNWGSASAVRVALIRVADKAVIATGVGCAIERIRARTITGVAGIASAGVTVVATGIGCAMEGI